MIVYAVHHYPRFVEQQRRAFARHASAAKFVVVVPDGWSVMTRYCEEAGLEYLRSARRGYTDIVSELADMATMPTLICEWDVLPIRPVRFEPACSYRGKQHAAMLPSARRFWYPNVVIVDPAHGLYEPHLPFSKPFRELEHRVIEGSVDGLPDCCEAAGFSLIGDEFVHYLHGEHYTAGRSDCWRQVANAVAPSGLGDMVSAGLSAIGITPERVSAALGVKDCGCRKRAEALNRLGRKLGIG
jgi:hypothetical protein